MERAVANIAKRYNLNEAQHKKTDELMKREVRRFLVEHENEIWPVIRTLIAGQFGPPDDVEETKRIGNAARPLLELAEKAILDANMEWREYLTPEQKIVHDHDLTEMESTFDFIDGNLEQWAQGNPTRRSIFPTPPAIDNSPRTPPRPIEGLPKPVRITIAATSFFQSFVEEFIKEYQLDEGQIDSARSILNEYNAKANDFRAANREVLAKIASHLQKANETRDLELSKKAEQERKIVLQPVYKLFEEMVDRLRGLLTSKQLAAYNAKHPAPATSNKPAPQKKPVVKKPAAPKESKRVDRRPVQNADATRERCKRSRRGHQTDRWWH